MCSPHQQTARHVASSSHLSMACLLLKKINLFRLLQYMSHSKLAVTRNRAEDFFFPQMLGFMIPHQGVLGEKNWWTLGTIHGHHRGIGTKLVLSNFRHTKKGGQLCTERGWNAEAWSRPRPGTGSNGSLPGQWASVFTTLVRGCCPRMFLFFFVPHLFLARGW